MGTLSKQDVFWIRRRIPDSLWTEMMHWRTRVIVAGGFIRSCITGEQVNDIDVFTDDKEHARLMALELNTRIGKKMIETENAFTVIGEYVPVQFIHRWTFKEPSEVVASFDFTIASAAVWISSEYDAQRHPILESICDDSFYQDLAAKRLIYRSPVRNEDAGGSLLRLLKFYQRGYRSPLESTAAVMARMAAAIDNGRLAGLMAGENLTSEQAIAKVFTGMLREVDPQIDPHHFTH